MSVPHEIYVGEVFMPPMLLAGILGVIAAAITARLLNKYRLSKYFFYPPLVTVALIVIYTVMIGWLIVPF